MEHLPKDVARAYANRLRRASQDLEKVARIGVHWLHRHHRERLAQLWALSGRLLRLSEAFDPPVDAEAPDWLPVDL